jgi:hypothetical protein
MLWQPEEICKFYPKSSKSSEHKSTNQNEFFFKKVICLKKILTQKKRSLNKNYKGQIPQSKQKISKNLKKKVHDGGGGRLSSGPHETLTSLYVRPCLYVFWTFRHGIFFQIAFFIPFKAKATKLFQFSNIKFIRFYFSSF